MAITKEKKKEILADLKAKLKDAESVAFVNFHGLSVADGAAMRAKLAEEGVSYQVIKKTLAKRALADTEVKGDMPELEGELALAWGPETAPAREVYNFQKEYDEAVQLTGGIFEGAFLDKEGITEIAMIPSLDVLRGMFVNLINSPLQRLAIVMNQIAEQKE